MHQRVRSTIIATGIAVLAFGVLAEPARADAIDGDWCNGASHLNIDGDRIVTPGRNAIQGRYTRYSFAYVVPANEPQPGTDVRMVMIRGQEIVHLTRAGQTGEPEVWRRCKPIS